MLLLHPHHAYGPSRGLRAAKDFPIAAAAVLGVTEPFSCGIGGGGFLVYYEGPKKPKANPHVFTLDQREKAPAAMKPDSFMENGRALAFSDARYSGLSVGVPGTVRWAETLRRYGSRKVTLAQALAPAIRVARNGFVIDQTFFDQVNGNRDYFDDVPATAALYLDADGTPRDVGTTLRNPDLAKRGFGGLIFAPRLRRTKRRGTSYAGREARHRLRLRRHAQDGPEEHPLAAPAQFALRPRKCRRLGLPRMLAR
ncbi:MAG: gamma-glutamyltransferase [Gaiellaceae bacterium]